MPIDIQTAVLMVKQRKDMLTGIHQRDEYITARVKSVIAELESAGIHLVDTPDDLMLVVDEAVWQYNNRDQGGAVPDWLRMRRRERWMKDRKINDDFSEALRLMEVIAGDP